MKKVEIRNVKYAAFASEETNCFEATVYIDGVKKGSVSNDGHGGCDDYSSIELQRELDEIAKQMPKYEFYGEMHEHNAETLIGELFTAWQMERDLKKLLAKRIAFTLPDKAGIYSTKPTSAAAYAKWLADPMLAKCLGTTDDRILNRMPFEKAIEVYKTESEKQQKVAA